MEKRWVLKEPPDKETVKRLSQELNIHPKLGSLLVQRGVTTFEEARTFFRPQLTDLHDPFLMKDMDKAVERINRAIKNHEGIMVYGDYDVDGTSAVALVYSFLKSICKKLIFYIPDRYNEGYGISYQGIDTAKKHGVKLIIALDCGIKAVEKVEYANKLGIDFIIGDHHRPGDKLPDACAVLDPKRPDCDYPYKELSGCGVGFKLTQALAQSMRINKEKVYANLDLVAVSIAADIVPITGENRVLAFYGLHQINENPRAGIYSILKSAGLENTDDSSARFFSRDITVSDLVFIVGPRINAAGRIESATSSVKLLITNNSDYADKLGSEINILNNTRRDLDSSITEEAIRTIESDSKYKNRKTTVIYKKDWHKGVIGIVASRLIDHFYKPTIVLTFSDGLITGSARSIKNFDIYDAIDSCSDILEHFGGHTYAAGLALKPENLDKFIERFEAYAQEHLTDEMMVPEIEIDEELFFDEINFKFYRILRQFAPFGPGNLSPLFVSNNVIDTGFAKVVGKNGQNHLKFEAVHTNHSGNPIKAIAFNLGEHYKEMSKGKSFKICYHLDENNWLGNISLQLRVKDIKFI